MNADEFLRSLRGDDRWTVSQLRNRPEQARSHARRMFSPRAIIAELALVAVVAAGVIGVVSLIGREPTAAPPATQPPASPPPSPAVDGVAKSDDGDVILLVALEPSNTSLMANISGLIGINDHGCVTVDDYVLQAPFGATVSPGGESVDIPPYGAIPIGGNLPGSAGGVGPYGGDHPTENQQKVLDLCGGGEYAAINPMWDQSE